MSDQANGRNATDYALRVLKWLQSDDAARELNRAKSQVRDAEHRLRDARFIDPAKLVKPFTV